MNQTSLYSLADPSSSHMLSSREETLAAIKIELGQKLAETAHNLVESGRLLIRAKQILGHGKFRNWLNDNFSMSSKTANRFMSVAQMVNRFQLNDAAVSQLLSMDLKTLYELSAKSTTESVQRQMLSELSRNREVSYDLIRSFKREDQLGMAETHLADSEFTHFTQRLQRFTSWFEANQQTLQAPLKELDARTRNELVDCAAKLREAQTLVEEILASTETRTIPVEFRQINPVDPIESGESGESSQVLKS